eukprot:1451952-Amphidinium_carterae.6
MSKLTESCTRQTSWEHIVKRIWPQALNFFHIYAPTRRSHFMTHYATDSISPDEYMFPAVMSGLLDTEFAFAQAQELGARTHDRGHGEVMNGMDQVNAHTQKNSEKQRKEDESQSNRLPSSATGDVHAPVQAERHE